MHTANPLPTPPDEAERAAFEAWARDTGVKNLTHREDGAYLDNCLEIEWVVWLATAAHRRQNTEIGNVSSLSPGGDGAVDHHEAGSVADEEPALPA